MKNQRTMRMLAAVLILALMGAPILTGCQSNQQPRAEGPDKESSSTSTEVSEEQDDDASAPPLLGSSMAGALTLDSSNRDNLGWAGTIDVQIKSATIYRNYDVAKRHVNHLIASEDALKDAPVLVCEVYLDNQNAKSQTDNGLFKADFMFLGPDRIPVTFYAPKEQGEKAVDENSEPMTFSLKEKTSTTIFVGFSVPQTWFDGSADLENRDYLAFGGTKEQYHRVGEGLVPDSKFIWLTTNVFDDEKQIKQEKK